MLMTSTPAVEYQRDSARVEKRGPCTTTTVPRRAVARPTTRPPRQGGAQLRAVGVGEAHVLDHLPVEVGVVPAPRPVDQLVEDDHVARGDVGAQRAHRARADDPADAEVPERPQVGPAVDRVGRHLVPEAVAGQEGDRPAPDPPDRDRRRRRAVRGRGRDFGGAVQPAVEAGPADDRDLSLNGRAHRAAPAAGLYDAAALDEEPDPPDRRGRRGRASTPPGSRSSCAVAVEPDPDPESPSRPEPEPESEPIRLEPESERRPPEPRPGRRRLALRLSVL